MNRFFTIATLLGAMLLAASPRPIRAQEPAPAEAAFAEPTSVQDAPVVAEEPAAAAEETTEAAPPAEASAEVATEPAVDAVAAPVAEDVAVEAPEAAPVEAGTAAPIDAPSETPTMVLTTEQDASGIDVTTPAGADNKISIALDNVPLQDVVRMFTRISGANIVSGTNLQGSVTVNLQDVEWEPALKVILDSSGMALVQKMPGIYAVIPKGELASEPITSDIIFLNYATVSNALPVVQQMLVGLTNSSVAAFPGANALVVQAPASRMNLVKDVIDRIDKQREQVVIEAKFVELNDQAIKDLGINWQVLQGYTVGVTAPQLAYSRTYTDRDGKDRTDTTRAIDVDSDIQSRSTSSSSSSSKTGQKGYSVSEGSGFNNNPPTPPTVSENNSSSASGSESLSRASASSASELNASLSGRNISEFDPVTGKLTFEPTRDKQVVRTGFQENEVIKALSAVLTAEDFALTLSALKQNTGVEIISNPKLLVASGETATIHVGRNEPNIVAVPQGDTGDRYAYQLDSRMPFIEIGVKLFVTPIVNTSNNITLKISPELSRKLGDKTVGEANTSFPVTQVRKINTEFNLESSRTVAIGGLTETTDQENVTKVPVLGDIPIIGKYFFRHTHTEKVQDEVIIFVTVNSASPNTLAQVSGIPEEGRLIHRHLAKRVEEAAKAEEMARKKAKKASPSPKSKR